MPASEMTTTETTSMPESETTTTATTSISSTPISVASNPVVELWPLSSVTSGYGVVGQLRPTAPDDFMCGRVKHFCQLSDTRSTYLDGSQYSYLQYRLDDLIFDGQLTIAFYLRPDPPGEGTVLDFKASSGKTSGVSRLSLELVAGCLHLVIEDASGVCNTISSTQLVPCEWSQIVIYRPVSQSDRIMVNSSVSIMVSTCTPYGGGPTGIATMTIGRQNNVRETPIGFHGSVSCLSIFQGVVDRALIPNLLFEQCRDLGAAFVNPESSSQCDVLPTMDLKKFHRISLDSKPGADLPHFNMVTVRSLLECSYLCLLTSIPCRSFAYNKSVTTDQCLFYDFVTKTGLTLDLMVDYYEILNSE